MLDQGGSKMNWTTVLKLDPSSAGLIPHTMPISTSSPCKPGDPSFLNPDLSCPSGTIPRPPSSEAHCSPFYPPPSLLFRGTPATAVTWYEHKEDDSLVKKRSHFLLFTLSGLLCLSPPYTHTLMHTHLCAHTHKSRCRGKSQTLTKPLRLSATTSDWRWCYGDCSQIKRHLLLGRKVMTNLDSILKSRDITLPTKVHLVKAMVFPVVMYGCESWSTKKAECWRIDAFEL